MNSYLSYLMEKLYLMGNEVKPEFPLSKVTSLGIGGPADVFITPYSMNTALETLRFLMDSKIEFRFMGLGTNLLVNDEGVEGVVMSTSNLTSVMISGDLLIAESGIPLKRLCQIALENSLSGLEELYGIPGSLGGAVFMNAGAYGKEISDVLEWVELFDGVSLRRFSPSDLGMGYRHGGVEGNFVTRIAIKLEKKDKESIEKAMNHFIRRRMEKQPVFEMSAGSLFRRPKPDFYVGKVLEESGFKGFRVGGVMISEKHAGFMINVGNGTFRDALALIETVRRSIYEKYGVMLDTEVILWR